MAEPTATPQTPSAIKTFLIAQINQMKMRTLITMFGLITSAFIWLKILYHTISESNARSIRVELRQLEYEAKAPEAFYEKLRLRDNEMREYFDKKFVPLQSAVNELVREKREHAN